MIEIKDVEHVARLARLNLTEDEKVKFSKQLGDILKYMEQLNEVDTTGVEPMNHPIDFSNVMREDVARYDCTREELMANAPEVEQDYFKVPKIS
ncbi:TPA: Asp-tRNA(Asn)/Glu-tRNA(Gln) amidotransferase subunit GatC [Candidatus Galligastranaerophilus intestinigallinarum]|nr:Asp-tRNA(Asn)/Glu-tRNA(Gln) amidotransferase subunit GatC [Candidatus Galligastranaerophilus intestinigallinarum]